MAGFDETIAALRLINTPKIGAGSFHRLVSEYGSAAATVDKIEHGGKYRPWEKDRALQEIETAAELGIRILLSDDDEYPAMLKASAAPPPILYVKGNVDALNYGKALAIVGARSASVTGRKTAARFAYDLSERGICIVSGMARGIDTSAHKGAMYARGETGRTIAVLGTGVDIPYPAENAELYEQIAVNGCIVSELPFGTAPNPQHFPQRNRIIAGLSEGVLVIEAGLNSGSLITARLAREQKKMLFAVPGTPGESRSQGVNLLIKEGAVLAETAADILPFLKGNKIMTPAKKETPRQKVLVFENNDANFSRQKSEPDNLTDMLTLDGVSIDELIRLSGKSAAEIAAEILELELNGIVERRAGNRIALCKRI